MFWKIRQRPKWGEYGIVIVGGVIDEDKSPHVVLSSRLGPCAPPIMKPMGSSNVLLSRDARLRFEECFSGYCFTKVEFVNTPWVEWDKWDLPQYNGVIYPDEEVLISLPHSEEAKNALGEFWSVNLEVGANSRTIDGSKVWEYTLEIDEASWSGRDIFLVWPNMVPITVVTDVMREWLDSNWPEWVLFEPAEST